MMTNTHFCRFGEEKNKGKGQKHCQILLQEKSVEKIFMDQFSYDDQIALLDRVHAEILSIARAKLRAERSKSDRKFA